MLDEIFGEKYTGNVQLTLKWILKIRWLIDTGTER